MEIGAIRLSGPLKGLTIQAFSMECRPNRHVWAQLTGILPESEGMAVLGGWLGEEKIQVTCEGTTLLTGLIKEAAVTYESGLYRLSARLVSGSRLLDRETRDRSFQDVGQTFEAVMADLLSDTPGAACLLGDISDRPTGVPFIQYRETDWAFAKRLASHLGVCLVPDRASGEPWFYLGMPWGRERGQLSAVSYTTALDWREYWRMEGESGDYAPEDFIYYVVESDAVYNIGDRVVFRGKNLRVREVRAEIAQSRLVFRYRLGGPALLARARRYNTKLQGVSLPGTVLESRKEDIRIRLDIDGERERPQGYLYPWLPVTGNALYLMPEVGDRVSLTVWGMDEALASAGEALWERVADGPEPGDPDEGRLITREDKRLNLLPDELSLEGTGTKAAPLRLALEDGLGITLTSHGALTLTAAGNVRLAGREARVSAAANLTLTKMGEGGPPSLGDESGSRRDAAIPVSKLGIGGGARVDAVGTHTLLAGKGALPYQAYDDEPGRGKDTRRPGLTDPLALLGGLPAMLDARSASPGSVGLLAGLPVALSVSAQAKTILSGAGAGALGAGGAGEAPAAGLGNLAYDMVAGASAGPTPSPQRVSYTGSGLPPGAGDAAWTPPPTPGNLEREWRTGWAGQARRPPITLAPAKPLLGPEDERRLVDLDELKKVGWRELTRLQIRLQGDGYLDRQVDTYGQLNPFLNLDTLKNTRDAVKRYEVDQFPAIALRDERSVVCMKAWSALGLETPEGMSVIMMSSILTDAEAAAEMAAIERGVGYARQALDKEYAERQLAPFKHGDVQYIDWDLNFWSLGRDYYLQWQGKVGGETLTKWAAKAADMGLSIFEKLQEAGEITGGYLPLTLIGTAGLFAAELFFGAKSDGGPQPGLEDFHEYTVKPKFDKAILAAMVMYTLVYASPLRYVVARSGDNAKPLNFHNFAKGQMFLLIDDIKRASGAGRISEGAKAVAVSYMREIIYYMVDHDARRDYLAKFQREAAKAAASANVTEVAASLSAGKSGRR